MSKKEKIVCAAVRLRKRNLQEDVLCLDYDDSFVENAVSSFERIFSAGKIVKTEGFITNKNRFVDPKEAMQIAVATSQVKNDFMLMSDPPQYRNLKPEDLY